MVLRLENDGSGLLIGVDRQTGKKQYYYGDRGLATIAAPGSGKTQGHMLPNLMTWEGPAIVLDVTGELWKRTSKQRRRFGPVYKFDVNDPKTSDHYNPFDMIRDDPDEVWHDSLTFANLVYSRPPMGSESRSNPFFDRAVPAYLAALACFIALKEPIYRRNGERLLEYAAGASLDGFLAYARKSGILALETTAATLDQADKDTKGNVIWSAKNALGPWEQPNIARLTRMSDWRPAMIRDHNATLYIRASINHLHNNPGLIRLLVGQHLQAFMDEKYVGRRDLPWVQLFLDEAPQLRHLDQLVEAIEAGRNYRLRTWIVMQWRGQLIVSYGKETAEGMIAACGLQAYLNPSLEDGMAQALSERIGERVSPIDGTKRPIVTPQALASKAYAGDVIAWDEGNDVRLGKRFYSDEPDLTRLEGVSP